MLGGCWVDVGWDASQDHLTEALREQTFVARGVNVGILFLISVTSFQEIKIF